MSRAKTRRPGTRGGRRADSAGDGRKEIPEDLADAAEAALDDLIHNAEVRDAGELDMPTTVRPAPPDAVDEAPTERPAARKAPPSPPPATSAKARAKGGDRAAPPFGGAAGRAQSAAGDRPASVIELGDSQRKRGDADRDRGADGDRIPTFGRGGDSFDRDEAHAFGRPLIMSSDAERAASPDPSRVATAATRGVTAELDELIGSSLRPDAGRPASHPARADSLAALDALALDEAEPEAAPEPDAESGEPHLLRFAVFEDADHLAAARNAIVAAGHSVAINASSPSGAAKIADAIVAGQVDAVLVGLPGPGDGAPGATIVEAALALEPHRPIVIAAYAGKATTAVKRAIAIGADLAVARPHDADRIAPTLLAASRIFRERQIARIARGAELVLRAKLEEIADPEPRGLQPFEVFQRVLELEFKRARRFEYPLSVALFAIEVTPPPPPAGIRGILRARAGTALIHSIRDVDLATQLDHERFLVLLPYTDLTGAAGVGRRVIAAVAQGEPVTSGGRSFPPRVVGAVAQAKPGEQLSFAKLMKDATRALDQARRDGAELAVQP